MRIMRLLVMFDLPVNSKKFRKAYMRFRKFLIEDGYEKEQYSVYSRLCLSRNTAHTHLERLKSNLPEYGLVTVFVLTESQYARREILVKPKESRAEKYQSETQMTLVF